MTFTRRSFLMGLAACPLCAATPRAEGAHWSYEDARSWGAHDPSARACAVGVEQSPIDLRGAIKADIHAPELSWKPQAFEIVNNGHTIQANASPGSFATSEGRKFELKQFHFHAPSEHAIDGERTAMEAHFVHSAENGESLVLGVLIKPGAKNNAFAAIMDSAPVAEGKAELKTPIDATTLLPKKRNFFRYEGSLTTPPCSEVVNWTVFSSPVDVASTDIEAFKKIFPMNARPLQDVHRRVVLKD